MNGLSERLLVSHYVNNYGGALRRLNATRTRLAAVDWRCAPVFEINGLKREELLNRTANPKPASDTTEEEH